MSFIEDCLRGRALIHDIDDVVEEWHEGEAGEDQELHEYLGMSEQEYGIWMTDPSVLRSIIAARRNRRTLEEELNADYYKMAARASTKGEVMKLEAWLKKIGKL